MVCPGSAKSREELQFPGKLLSPLQKDAYQETGLQGHSPQYSGRKITKLVEIMFTPSHSNKNNDFIWTYCYPRPMTVVAKSCFVYRITGFILSEKTHLLLNSSDTVLMSQSWLRGLSNNLSTKCTSYLCFISKFEQSTC